MDEELEGRQPEDPRFLGQARKQQHRQLRLCVHLYHRHTLSYRLNDGHGNGFHPFQRPSRVGDHYFLRPRTGSGRPEQQTHLRGRHLFEAHRRHSVQGSGLCHNRFQVSSLPESLRSREQGLRGDSRMEGRYRRFPLRHLGQLHKELEPGDQVQGQARDRLGDRRGWTPPVYDQHWRCLHRKCPEGA